jgi:hypothetical protein
MWNRRCKSQYYGATDWSLGFNGLAVCYCDTWPGGPYISCDAWLIKIKEIQGEIN